MHKKYYIIISLLLTICIPAPATIWNSKDMIVKFPATIAAMIALPVAVACFYRGSKAFGERRALMKAEPWLEDLIKLLQKQCAEYDNPDQDWHLAINWANVYDQAVREKNPELADQLLELHAQESHAMIAGFLATFIGISTSVVALNGEWR